MVLVRKWPFFQLFSKAFLRYKNKKFEKSKNLHFFKEFKIFQFFPFFWSNDGHFSNFFFFLLNVGQENVFYDFLERKNAFVGYKNIFLKRLTHGFGLKMAFFPVFLLRQYIGQEDVFYDILERKIAFLDY